MDTPPPYRPKKTNTGLIIGLIIGGVVVCCLGPLALLVGGGIWGMQKMGGAIQCTVSVQAMRDAIIAYANANGKLPDADKWQDQVRTFYEKEIQRDEMAKNPFGIIPAAGPWNCSDENKVPTGIAYNKDLSGKKLADIKDPHSMVMLFEVTETGGNLSLKYDPAKLGDSPKRMGQPMRVVAHVSGDPTMIGAGGKSVPVKVDGP